MLNIYKNIIKKLIKNKYKNSPIFSKNFLYSFFNARKLIKKNIVICSTKNQKNSPQDQTLVYLKKINKKKNLTKHDKVILMVFYKKFEVNLSLKRQYTKNFIKISNKKTNFISYLILSELIKNNKLINDLQLLNFFLKIFDKFIFMKKIELNNYYKQILINLIKFEEKIIYKYFKQYEKKRI